MSQSGSVFRHGTLRWTYAQRSKLALRLPQCIPNRSDKVPPLCDPDPLLIMDRLQNRPLWGRTVPAHRAAVWAQRRGRGTLMNTHDTTCRPSFGMTTSNWFGARVVLSLRHVYYRHDSFQSAFCYNCVFIVSQESVRLQRHRTSAKFWRVPSSRLIFLLKQQCAGLGFHLSYFFHFARESSTHLWLLNT